MPGNVIASRSSALFNDQNGDGKASPGDTLITHILVSNGTGAAITAVVVNDSTMNGTTVVAGSTVVTAGDTYTGITGNTPFSGNVLANDYHFDGPFHDTNTGLLVGAVNGAAISGTTTVSLGAAGSVSMGTNGAFTFTPATGFNGNTSFTYSTSDGSHLLGTVTVNLTVTGLVWYVDSNASSSGADGSYLHPFTSLAPLNGSANNGAITGDPDGAGDTIFVYNRGTAYSGGITLESDQKLYGDSHQMVVNGHTIGGGANHSAVDYATAGIVLNSGNTIDGFDLYGTQTSAAGIKDNGDTVGTLSITNTNIGSSFAHAGGLGLGETLSIQHGGTVNATFGTLASGGSVVSSYSTGVGMQVSGDASNTLAGTLIVNGGQISSASSYGIEIGDGSAGHAGTIDVTYGGAIGGNSGPEVFIDGTGASNDITISANISHTGGGISGIEMNHIAGGNINFTGQVDASNSSTTGNGVHIAAQSGGTVTFHDLSAGTVNGSALAIDGMSGGTFTVDGSGVGTLLTTSGTGAAVNLLNNTAGTITFSGGGLALDVNGSGGTGLLASGNSASTTITGTGNQITASGGAALVSMANSTIGAGGMTFDSLDAAGTVAGNAISFSTVTGGAFASTTTDVAGATGHGISIVNGSANVDLGTGTVSTGGIHDVTLQELSINGGTGNFTYNGPLTKTSAGLAVQVQNKTGGTVALGGAITGNNAAGGGISLTSDTGATVNFTGKLSLTTGSMAGFTATGGGTVSSSDTTSTITTTTGTAVNISNTNIGASNVTFKSVSSNGAVNGINLNNTGSSGGLHVIGTGNTTIGGDPGFTGGTIQNSTGSGILLANTANASFVDMRIINSAGSGVRGSTGVNNFTFNYGTINNSGTGGGNQESSIAFNDPTGSATDAKVTGNVSIVGNTLTNALWHGVSILQFAGSLSDVNISSNTITSGTTTGTGGNSFGSGIQIALGGTDAAVASLTQAEINNNTITNFPGGVPIALQGGTSSGSGPVGTFGIYGSPTRDVEVQNNIIKGGGSTVHPNQDILIAVNGRGEGNFNVQNNGTLANPLSGAAGNIIDISAGGNVKVEAIVKGNVIDAAGQTVAGTSGIAAGVGPFAVTGLGTLSTSTLYIDLENNNVKNSLGSGIRLNVNAGDPTLNAIVKGNTVGAATGSGTYAIQVVEGNNAGFTGNVNLEISGNTATGSSGGGNTFAGIGLRKFGATAGEFNIVGLTNGSSNAQMEAYVAGQNPGSSASSFGTMVGATAANGSSSNWGSLGSVPKPPVVSPLLVTPPDATSDTPSGDKPVADPVVVVGGGGTSDAPPPPPPPSTDTGSTPLPPAPPSEVTMNLTQADLDKIVTAAIARWAAAGATPEQIAAMKAVTVTVSDIYGLQVGDATPGHILISANGAGYGWFVDATPNDDNEFTGTGTELAAKADGAAAGHVDLLTVVEHELGHQIGLSDDYAPADSADLMYGYVNPGERRLASSDDVHAATGTPVDHEAFAIAPVTIASITAGSMVDISYESTVNSFSPGLVPTLAGSSTTNYTGGALLTTTESISPTADTLTDSGGTVTTQALTVESLTLGNLVFKDNDKDGKFSAGDVGIGGVTLQLYLDNGDGVFGAGDTQVATTVTSTAAGTLGQYSFTGLAPGNYIVVVPAANFASGQVLNTLVPHNGAIDPDTGNVDNDNNGIAVGGDVASLPITLSFQGEFGTNGDTNNTLDFGFQANSPPTAITQTLAATDEDNAKIYQGTDFTTGDVDPDGDTFSLTAVGAPSHGSAVLNGDGTVTYTPTGNYNGPDSFSYTVTDSHGASSVGTANVTVNAINDAPSVVIASGLAATEQTATSLKGSITVADVDSGANAIYVDITVGSGVLNASVGTSSVIISGTGTNGVRITGTIAQINNFLNTNATSSFTFTSVGDSPPATISITAEVHDNGFTGNGGDLSSGVIASSIAMTPVNDPPSGHDESIHVFDNDTHVFTLVDFNTGYSDAEGDLLKAVKIDSLPASGALTLNGSAVHVGDFVLASDISGGKLIYTPDGSTGGQVFTFNFQVQDKGGTANGGVDLDPNQHVFTLNVDISHINEEPAGADFTTAIAEDGRDVFAASDFGFTDSDPAPFTNTLKAVILATAPAHGTIYYDADGNPATPDTALAAGDSMSKAGIDAGKYYYKPNANYNGNDSFTFQVQDTGGTSHGGVDTDQSANTYSIGITPVNDPPVYSGATAGSGSEDGSIVFSSAGNNAIVISDPESGAETYTATLTVAHGTLAATASGSAQVGTSGTASITVSGSLADVNATLDGLTYSPAANFNGADTLHISTKDNGGTASNGIDVGTTDIALTVSAVNDAPALSAQSPVTTDEQIAVAFAPAMTVSDIDLDAFNGGAGNYAGATLRAANNNGDSAEDVFSIANGAHFTVSGNQLLDSGGHAFATFTGGNGTPLVITFTSSAAPATTALVQEVTHALQYTNTSDNPPASVSIAITLNDGDFTLGNQGAEPHGIQSDSLASRVVTVNITPVNDNPALDLDSTTGGTGANNGLFEQDPTGAGGIAPRAVVTDVDSADFDTGTLTVSITANGQGGDHISILSYFSDGGHTHTITTSGSDVLFDNVIVGTFTAGDSTTPLVVTFNANATPLAAGWVTKAVDVTFTANDPSAATRTLHYVITDGDGGSASADATYNVTSENDAPVLTAPTDASVSFTENNAAVAILQGVVLSDPDNPANFSSGSIDIAVSGTPGGVNLKAGSNFSIHDNGNNTYTLMGPGNVAIGDITGWGTTHLQVTNFTAGATLATLNDLIDDFTFSVPGDDVASAAGTITLTFNDGHNTGYFGDGALTATQTQSVTVIGVNDAPTNNVPGAQSPSEDGSFTFDTAHSNLISISDPDDDGGSMTVTLSVAHGTISLSGIGGLSFTTGDGTTDPTMTFSGTKADINTALNGLVYAPTANFNGDDLLSITTSDNGHSGTGSALQAADTVALHVLAVNDAPTVVNGNITTAPTIKEDHPSATGSTVSSLFASHFSDATDQVSGGSSANGFAGVAVTGNASSGATGHWQYLSGGTWIDIPATSDASAFLLSAATAIRFNPALNYNGEAPTLTVHLIDDSSGPVTSAATADVSAPGGTSRYSTMTIDLHERITAVNNAPINHVPGGQNVNEDGTLVFTGANAISVSDSDAGTGNLTMVISVLHGTLTLAHHSAMVAELGDTTDTVQLTGSQADLTAILDGLQYTPTANYNGPDTLSVQTGDNGNTGTGGPQSASDSVAINVAPVNDPPVITPSATASETEQTAVILNPNWSVSDVDLDAKNNGAGDYAGANFSIGRDAGADAEDTFTLHTAGASFTVVGNTLQSGGKIFATFSTAGHVLNIAFTSAGTVATTALVNDVLKHIEYTNGSDTPPASVDLTYNFNDGAPGHGQGLVVGGNNVSSGQVTVNITAVDDAPANDVPVAQTINEDATRTFSTANMNAITVSDVDAGTGNVSVTLSVGHGTLTLGSTGSVTATGDGSGTVQVTGTVANVNAALDGLVYAPAANFNGDDTIHVVTSDLGNTGTGGPLTDTDDVTVHVTAVNDAPTVVNGSTATAPAIDEDTPGAGDTVSSLFGGNYSDAADAVPGGSSAGAFTGIAITGNASSPTTGQWQYYDGAGWVDVGTVSDASALTLSSTALLRFKPAQDYNGTAPDLTVHLADNTASITDGAHIDLSGVGATGGTTAWSTGTVALSETINAINDAPDNSVPGAQSVQEDGTLTFGTATSNAITVSDVDAGASSVTVTLSVAHGTLTLGSSAGLTVTGDGTGTVQVTGTTAAINAGLNGLGYHPTGDFNGSDAIHMVTSDNGHTGNGGPLTDTDDIAITVTPLNDSPTVINGSTATAPAIPEDTPSTTGDTVASLFSSHFSDSADNVPAGSSANNFAGVAVTGNASGANGHWQYYDGSTWVNIPTAVSDTSAFVLSAATLVRFNPAQDYNGSAPDLTVHLIDDSAGAVTTGTTANLVTLIVNGDFENGAAVPPGGFTEPGVGDPSITGWSIVSGNVDYINGYWQASSGTRSIDLSGDQPGAIAQTFATVVGETYTVTFDLAGSPGQPGLHSVQASAGDTTRTFTADSTGHDNSNLGWTTRTFSFVATSTSTTLTFASLDSGPYGPVLDHVSVQGTQYSAGTVTLSETITPVNDAPVIDLNGAAAGSNSDANYTEQHSAVALAPDGTVVDVDSTDFAGATLTVTLTAGTQDTDILEVIGMDPDDGGIIAHGDIIATVAGGQNGDPLVITFNALATRADVEHVLQTIGFANNSDAVTSGDRTVTFTLTDGDGGTSNTATSTVHVTAVDDLATLMNDTKTTDEVHTVVIDVLANDSDVDGPTPKVTMINNQAVSAGQTVVLASGALATLNADGTITYDPYHKFDTLTSTSGGETGAKNTQGTDTFTYTTQDGSTATVTVTVNGVAGPGDVLRGDAQDDVITGTSGNDLFMLQDGGNDTAVGGAGNDVFYFGAAMTSADKADGGDGRDALVLQGDYSGGLTFGAESLVNMEALSLQSGSITKYGDTANNLYSYNITMVDANVAAGQQLIVNALNLLAGENFTFDGSAETNGSFLIYGGFGTDHLKGGAGNDIFDFEGDRWNSTDTVDGGGGRDAVVITGSVSGVNHIVIGVGQLTNIAALSVSNVYTITPGVTPSYDIVLNDGNVTPGGMLIVNAGTLTGASQTFSLDAHTVTGNLFAIGGAGHDTIVCGSGNDIIYGGLGQDDLTGGAGADIFQYRSIADSTTSAPDHILDFTPGTDKIDLHFIDANPATPADDAFVFSNDGTFHGINGEIREFFDAAHGWWVIDGDVDGDGQADFTIHVTTAGNAPLANTDFIL